MREPPANLADDTLRSCLRDRYGLTVVELAFLPLGHDASAWVYRARAADSGIYFLKARLGGISEAGLAVPRYLHDRGIARVVAPLPTMTGALWADVGAYVLILYPFVASTTGMERGMTAQQWADYGAQLRRVHDAAVGEDLTRLLGREAFTPAGADTVRRLHVHIEACAFAGPAASALARFWHARRDEIRALVDRAEDLGRRLGRAAPPLVLCHADIHTANVLLDADGRVWLVDWDVTILAPRERDLMFVVGGISRKLVGPREEAHFFRGYGATTINPLALAYYRYAWAVGDIGAFGEQVFFQPDLGPDTKRAAADLFMGLFQPGEIVDLALSSSERPA